MFRMLGKKVELIRYKVTWQEDEQEMQEDCISEGHKNEIGIVIAEDQNNLGRFLVTPINDIRKSF